MKFYILIALQVPAILLSSLIFIFFVTHQSSLYQLHNQALLVLLIINFIYLSTDLLMPLRFYYFGYVSPATSTYCTLWTFLEYSLNLINELLMATISIQRHPLVFKAHIFQTRWKLFLCYYLPLALCFIYPIAFYVFTILLYPCDGNQWDYMSNVCGFANCYLIYDKVLGSFDWAANNGFPALVILLANVILIVRVIKQKRRRQQTVSWRKQRLMTLHLCAISSLYLLAWFPSLSIGLIQQLISPNFASNIQTDYTLDLIYSVCLLLPWVCLGLLPEFKKWIQRILTCGKSARASNIVHAF
ncbi:unnamed protein product [Adineta ricciae]|uniref:G-protein coupled receptors family 1 profile domain-containing protein n=1 Tax=Adineta ricciae TaxID=249248 RepID=A0A815TUI5_ADIRI|nr:unnamed protein product [Adineta ricciae]